MPWYDCFVMKRRRRNDVREVDGQAPLFAFRFAPPEERPRPGKTLVMKRRAGEGYRSPEAELRLNLQWRGLVASASPLDALLGARGPFVSRLALSGAVLVNEGNRSQLYAERAECVAGADATMALRRLAAAWASRALERSGDDDRRPAEALRCLSRWLDGSLPFERLGAARDAALEALRADGPAGPLGSIRWAISRNLPLQASESAAIAAARSAVAQALQPEAHFAARSVADGAAFAAGVFAAAQGDGGAAVFHGAHDYELGTIERELAAALGALLGTG